MRSLLDTNVLVYTDAADDPVRQRRAIDLITSLRAALIVQAAIASGCQRVLSEDMQHGARFGGVRIENPFAEA